MRPEQRQDRPREANSGRQRPPVDGEMEEASAEGGNILPGRGQSKGVGLGSNSPRPGGEAESGARKAKSALRPQTAPLESLRKVVSTGEKQIVTRTLPVSKRAMKDSS